MRQLLARLPTDDERNLVRLVGVFLPFPRHMLDKGVGLVVARACNNLPSPDHNRASRTTSISAALTAITRRCVVVVLLLLVIVCIEFQARRN